MSSTFGRDTLPRLWRYTFLDAGVEKEVSNQEFLRSAGRQRCVFGIAVLNFEDAHEELGQLSVVLIHYGSWHRICQLRGECS